MNHRKFTARELAGIQSMVDDGHDRETVERAVRLRWGFDRYHSHRARVRMIGLGLILVGIGLLVGNWTGVFQTLVGVVSTIPYVAGVIVAAIGGIVLALRLDPKPYLLDDDES